MKIAIDCRAALAQVLLLCSLSAAPAAGLACAAASSHSEYTKSESFRTLQPIAVIETDEGMFGRRLALVPLGPRGIRESMLHVASAQAVEQFCREGKCEPNEEHIVAVLPVGTVLNISDIKHRRGYSLWGGRNDDFMVVAASPLPMPGGASTVDMTDLSVWKCSQGSRRARDEIPFSPNPRVLKTMEPEQARKSQ